MQLLLQVCAFDAVSYLQQLLSIAVTDSLDVCNHLPNHATQSVV